VDYIQFGEFNYFELLKIEIILKKNNIAFFIKKSYDSSVIAGWPQPTSEFNSSILFIDKNKLILVRKLLKKPL
tara:strand:+ start:121 stop:339 length:219 start_codon:yes stop_codon:yes gene_type:complete